jgi:hypothetical protein
MKGQVTLQILAWCLRERGGGGVKGGVVAMNVTIEVVQKSQTIHPVYEIGNVHRRFHSA